MAPIPIPEVTIPMPVLSPENFWRMFKDELLSKGSWKSYQSKKLWTPLVKNVAESVCQRFGFKTIREYYRLDVAAWESRSNQYHDWDLRVAFEAENTPTWEGELCKLTHLIADLKVLVAYQASKTRRCEDDLEKCLGRHVDRIARVAGCKWLFVFGPHSKNRNDHWAAYYLDSTLRVSRIQENNPLLGSSWAD